MRRKCGQELFQSGKVADAPAPSAGCLPPQHRTCFDKLRLSGWDICKQYNRLFVAPAHNMIRQRQAWEEEGPSHSCRRAPESQIAGPTPSKMERKSHAAKLPPLPLLQKSNPLLREKRAEKYRKAVPPFVVSQGFWPCFLGHTRSGTPGFAGKTSNAAL